MIRYDSMRFFLQHTEIILYLTTEEIRNVFKWISQDLIWQL